MASGEAGLSVAVRYVNVELASGCQWGSWSFTGSCWQLAELASGGAGLLVAELASGETWSFSAVEERRTAQRSAMQTHPPPPPASWCGCGHPQRGPDARPPLRLPLLVSPLPLIAWHSSPLPCLFSSSDRRAIPGPRGKGRKGKRAHEKGAGPSAGPCVAVGDGPGYSCLLVSNTPKLGANSSLSPRLCCLP